MKSAWWDMDKRGRRLEAIGKRMNTMFWDAMKDGEEELAFTYLHRLLLIEKQIQPYVEQATGIRRILKEYDRKNPPKLVLNTE